MKINVFCSDTILYPPSFQRVTSYLLLSWTSKIPCGGTQLILQNYTDEAQSSVIY